ncbi:SwmB domain-containing protein, partial [Acetivibrio saccincola]|uniref:SwmB domain-containing protein n=1 Tax=Acetivibrio saccincola TaxID=1677857 RepID=UPI002C8F6D81
DAPEVEKVEATAKDKLVVTFTQRLLEGNNINKEAFDVKVDGKSATIGSISVSRVDGKTVVTLNLKDVEINANADNVKLTIVNDGGEYLKNLFGVPVADDDFGGTIKDKIAPSIVVNKDKKLDITAKNEDGKGVIQITFDENIKNSTTVRDFEVSGYTVENVTANGKVVTITLDKEIKGSSVKLTQKFPVKDIPGNEFKLDKTETITVTNPVTDPGED